jgi:hypothetical protein
MSGRTIELRRLAPVVLAIAALAASPATASASSSPGKRALVQADARALAVQPAKAVRPTVLRPNPGDPICPECKAY